MGHKEAMSRLRLARTTYVGPITCQLLMARYGTAVKALAAIPEISARGGRKLTPFPADKARVMLIEAITRNHGRRMVRQKSSRPFQT